MKNAVPNEHGIAYNEFSNPTESTRHVTILGRFNNHSRKEKWWMGLGILLLVIVIIKLIISGIYFQMSMNRQAELAEYVESITPQQD